MAVELHSQELDIWKTITVNLSNTTEISKHTMKLLLRLKLLVAVDELLYALHFLRRPNEAKGEEKELKVWEEKRANTLTDVIKGIHYTLRPLI
jgi:hypothetical protein